jgi:putative glutamine amidotransferase
LSAPIIGVTSSRSLNQFGYPQFSVSEAYTASLSNAGASPVLIPLGLPETTLQTIVQRLDGILFSGGGDIDPRQYGNDPHPLVSDVDPDRDQVEIQLLHQVMKEGLPILGICRGLQIINVALGGSLYEDVLEQHPKAVKHRYYPDWPRDHLAHTVQVETGSQLMEILGTSTVQVNSLHHQGVNQLAPGLRASSYAPDGLIEGFELQDYPYGLAVQWHPENLQAYAPMRELFKSFVEAAGNHKRA